MPPWILAAAAAAIPGLLTGVTIALFLGPFFIPVWAATLEEKRRLELLAAIKGANDTLGPIVAMTPTDLDDRVAAVGRMVERELGKARGKDAVVKREAITVAVVTKSAAVPAPVGYLGRLGPEARSR